VHPGKLYATTFHSRNLTGTGGRRAGLCDIAPGSVGALLQRRPNISASPRQPFASGESRELAAAIHQSCQAASDIDPSDPRLFVLSISANRRRLDALFLPYLSGCPMHPRTRAAQRYYVPHASRGRSLSVALFVLMAGLAYASRASARARSWLRLVGVLLFTCCLRLVPHVIGENRPASTTCRSTALPLGPFVFIFSESGGDVLRGLLLRALLRAPAAPACSPAMRETDYEPLLWPHLSRSAGRPTARRRSSPRADGSFETIPALGVPLVTTLIPADSPASR